MGTNSNGWTPEQVRENRKYYDDCLAKAQEYQDFVVHTCWERLGLAIVQYASREYQYRYGESRTGVEIKFDSEYVNTGNIFIEVEERVPPNENYVPSGIFRNDNSWLYIIGDYDTIYIFSKKFLQDLSRGTKNGKRLYTIKEIKRQTARGFCMPEADAEKYCIKVLRPEQEYKEEAAVPTLITDAMLDAACPF